MRYDYSNCTVCLCAQYYRECTSTPFIKMYDAQDTMAHFLNVKVASLATVPIKSVDGCGYSVRAALKRAYREKERQLEHAVA
jgi:hypothetical protein